MLNKFAYSLVTPLFLLATAPANGQTATELSTLFTTPQERQIINSNRYKTDKKPNLKVSVDNPEPVEVRELIKEEIKLSYRISGISINADGLSVAWVNSRSYENGDSLEDGSKLKINDGAIKSVSIIAPDGKRHTGTSGETLEVTYMRALEE